MPKTPEELLAVRTKVAAEILSTEKSYVESLGTLVDIYLKKFQEADRKGKKDYMSAKEIQTTFGNIELVVELNGRFLKALEAEMSTYTNSTCIGHIFCEYAPFFKMYVTYCNGHSQAVHDYRKMVKKRDALQKFEQDCMANPRCKGLSFESYLIMPIQRIPRYKLLLTELLRNTPENHPDMEDLSNALETVSEVAVKINEEIRHREARDKALEIQDLFVGEIPELIAPGRNYIMDGDLMKICRKADKQFHFFLFTDLFLYAGKGTRSGSYVLHRQFPINSGFMVIDAQDHAKPAFQIRHAQKSFVVYAKDQEEKKKWLEAINNCITEAYNRSIRANVDINVDAAPVWAPDSSSKNCEICRKGFSVVNRRHHCRRCGRLVDGGCSRARMRLPNIGDEDKVRVCDICVVDIAEAEEELAAHAKGGNSSKENSKRSNAGAKESNGSKEANGAKEPAAALKESTPNSKESAAGSKYKILNSDVQGEFMAALASKSPEFKGSGKNLFVTTASRDSTPVSKDDDEESDDDYDDPSEYKTEHSEHVRPMFSPKTSVSGAAPLPKIPTKTGISLEPASGNRLTSSFDYEPTEQFNGSMGGYSAKKGPPPKPPGPPPKKNQGASPATIGASGTTSSPSPSPNISPSSTMVLPPSQSLTKPQKVIPHPKTSPPHYLEEKVDHSKHEFNATSPKLKTKHDDMYSTRADFASSLPKSPPLKSSKSTSALNSTLGPRTAAPPPTSALPAVPTPPSTTNRATTDATAAKTVTAIKAYDGSIEGYKLSYEIGDKVQILRKGEKGFYVELVRTGMIGWVHKANFEEHKA